MTKTRRLGDASARPSRQQVTLLPPVEEFELTGLATDKLMHELSCKVEDKTITPTRITDRYVPGSGKHFPHMKLRFLRHAGAGGQYLQVIKESVNGERGHWRKSTVVLSAEAYNFLKGDYTQPGFDLTVVKDRYKMNVAGHFAHIYVYLGDLSGLVTVSFRRLANAKQRADLRSEIDAGVKYSNNHISQLFIDADDRETDLNGCALAALRYDDMDWLLRSLGYSKLPPAKYGLARR